MPAGRRYSPLSIALLTGLSLLSWISTYTGMLELVNASAGQVSLTAQIAIGFAVFMLQLMILYILDALFSGHLRWWLWPTYILGYIILFAISAGFAFGFYWKYLEAGAQTTRAAGTSVLQVQQALQLGQTRLEQLQSTFTTLSTISSQKAEVERNQGGTCPRSGPGDGPRRRLRDADAQRFQFATEYISQRTQVVRADIASLTSDLQKLARNDPSTIDPATRTRTAFVEELERKLGLVATRFNAIRSDPQLHQIRDELQTRAGQTSFPDDRGRTFVCPDPQLQTALNGVVRSIDNLPELDAPELRSVEGSEAVVEAFRRLTTTGIALLTRGEMPPSPEELRAARGVTVQSAEEQFQYAEQSPGLSSRDYIPLMIAIFVDLCIFLVSINRPFGPFFNLGESLRHARTQGPMQRVFATFYEVFQNSFGQNERPAPLQLIAPIQDVVFDYRSEYHAAVPLDFREENYQRWLEDRRMRGDEPNGSAISGNGFDPRDPLSYRPLETSRYIASIFTVLEGEGLVRLIAQAPDEDRDGGFGGAGARRRRVFVGEAASDLNTAAIRQQLDEQGSVYGQADRFRLYRFRKGAWPALLMQVVGSSAQVEEMFRRRMRGSQRVLARGEATPAQIVAERREALAGGSGVEHRGSLKGIDPAEGRQIAGKEAPKALLPDTANSHPEESLSGNGAVRRQDNKPREEA